MGITTGFHRSKFPRRSLLLITTMSPNIPMPLLFTRWVASIFEVFFGNASRSIQHLQALAIKGRQT